MANDEHGSKKSKQRQQHGVDRRAPVQRVAPGKKALTASLGGTSAQAAAPRDQSATATAYAAAAAPPRVKSGWEWTMDSWMDAAHRGTRPPEHTSESPTGTRVERTLTQTPVVQRRERPGAQAPDTGSADARTTQGAQAEATHDHTADQVEALLSRPDPVAGIGDPRAALGVLAKQPLDALLDALDALDARGLLPALLPYLDSASDPEGRIRTALLTRDMARMGPEQAQGMPLHDLAAGLSRLPQAEHDGVVRYMIARRRISPELEMLIEGMIALEDADQPATGPMAAGTTAGAGLPAPIGPGAWERSGNQPMPLYVGNQAHKQIAQHYESAHRGQEVAKNAIPMVAILERLRRLGHRPNPSALSASELAMRPDLSNLSLVELLEIKPEAQRDVARAQAAMYIGVYRKAGITMSLGPSNDPGVSGQIPAPGGVFLFWSPEPGVILYQYRRGRLVPVPVPAAQSSRQKQSARDWRWELEPLTKAQQHALAAATAGTVMLILMMILLAPVGV